MATSPPIGAIGRIISERPLKGSDLPPFGPASPGTPSGSPGPESPRASSILCWVHPEWGQRFPWLLQGITGRSPISGSGDFRIFETEGSSEAEANWSDVARFLGFSGIVHSRQVHGREILTHADPVAGLCVGEDSDGHLSEGAGVLMGVTVADCVPVYLLDPSGRGAALLHAGWRGAAAGILGHGVRLMSDRLQSAPEDFLLHLGPSICHDCYEVGPEVHTALGFAEPPGPQPVDLRGALATQALEAGLLPARITRSAFCTRCGGSPFFSHRGGESKRQMAFLGVRANA